MAITVSYLFPARIADLRPTQATVGFREVERRRSQHKKRRAQDAHSRAVVPTVLGPKGRPYLIDHHHLARALLDDGETEVLTSVVADISSLSKPSFWRFLDNRTWCHPYDASGRRRSFKIIPTSLAELQDDPFRSLAGELRRAGGYAKDLAPFSEFLWADYLRTRVDEELVEQDFDAAVKKAVKLAKDKDAGFLPGWCGPS